MAAKDGINFINRLLDQRVAGGRRAVCLDGLADGGGKLGDSRLPSSLKWHRGEGKLAVLSGGGEVKGREEKCALLD